MQTRNQALIFSDLLRAVQPAYVLGAALVYALGGGIHVYLGGYIRWDVFFSGLAVTLLLAASAGLLRTYFERPERPPFDVPSPRRRPPTVDPSTPTRARTPANASASADASADAGKSTQEAAAPEPTPRVVFLQAAAGLLTAAAALIVLLLAQGRWNPTALIFLVGMVALALAYGVPPLRLVTSGYGELALAVLAANLAPGLALALQNGALHRLLPMLTFPLTLLILAALLAFSLRGFGADQKYARGTMLLRLGWQRGMSLHNGLLAAAYLVLAGAVVAGLPGRLAWPGFFSLPVAAFQVWQMNGIANGAPPRWRLLRITALASAGLMAYFLNLALWIG